MDLLDLFHCIHRMQQVISLRLRPGPIPIHDLEANDVSVGSVIDLGLMFHSLGTRMAQTKTIIIIIVFSGGILTCS